ncbi:hypothetical protein GUITHDRAFT_64531, partial [Guillardia theta CCMP2712]
MLLLIRAVNRELSLANRKELGQDGRVYDALKFNSVLTSLDLSLCDLGPLHATDISEALLDNSQLTRLTLSHNPIGDEGFQKLASSLRFEDMRKKKDSMLNELEVAGLREIDAVQYYAKQKGNAFLKELRCKNCYIYDEGGHMMAETLRWNRTLTVLDLGRNSIGHSGTIALAAALAHHPTLTSLNLEGNVFGSEAGKALAQMLRSNTCLTACYLADNSIADNGTEEFTEMLKVNTTLQSLDLSGNIVQADCALRFAKTISECQVTPILTEFKLLRNDI